MLHFLPSFILGPLSLLLCTLNTVFWTSLLFVMTALKIVLPLRFWQDFCARVLMVIGQRWIDGNNFILWLAQKTQFDVQGMENLTEKGWYLVIANHQYWTDILVLQKIFNRRIPFLKFFLKKELIWVPLLGPAWWALDFPFMKRYTKEFIAKHPELKGKDLETTRKACEKFRRLPVSVINFVEGTRFTQAKHDKQKSPFKNLLSPKAGGVGFVLSSMGDMFTSILDVTLVYPDPQARLWDLLCGRVNRVIVRVRSLPVPQDLTQGDYGSDEAHRARLQEWVNGIWSEKDALMTRLVADLKDSPSSQSAA